MVVTGNEEIEADGVGLIKVGANEMLDMLSENRG